MNDTGKLPIWIARFFSFRDAPHGFLGILAYGLTTIAFFGVLRGSDLLQTQGFDHSFYVDTIRGLQDNVHQSVNFVAAIYGTFPSILAGIVAVYILFGAVAFLIAIRSANIVSFLMMLFLLLPAALQLRFISKEGVFVLLSFSIAVLYRFVRKENIRSSSMLSVLVLFGIFFRDYYILSALSFIFIFFITRGHRIIAITVLVSVLAIAPLLFPNRIFEILQIKRDLTEYAFYSGARSAFDLDLGWQSPYALYWSYLDTLIQSLTSALITLDFRDAYANIYLIVLIGLIVHVWRNGDRSLLLFSLSIYATLPLFVPDLGTFVRHLSAQAPLIYLALLYPLPRDRVQERIQPDHTALKREVPA